MGINKHLIILSTALLISCGGGGGGSSDSTSSGSGYGNTVNTAPNITNTNTNISVQENQTSAFTINASDSNGDVLSYSLSGDDSSLLSVSNQGVVTFNTAPDYENPSDADSNNIYKITANVSDGSLNTSANFEITVTNDSSDDPTSTEYDGTYIGAGPIQGATICIEVTEHTCTGAQYTTTTAQDGTFSLTYDSDATDIVIRGQGGFDPVTNLQFDDVYTFALDQPVTDKKFIDSPLSSMLN